MFSTTTSRSQHPESLTQSGKFPGGWVERRRGGTLFLVRPRKKNFGSTENCEDESQTADGSDNSEPLAVPQAPRPPVPSSRFAHENFLTNRVEDVKNKQHGDPNLDIPPRQDSTRFSDIPSGGRYSPDCHSRSDGFCSNAPSAALRLYRSQSDTGAHSPRSPCDERRPGFDLKDADYHERGASEPGCALVRYSRTKTIEHGCGENYSESKFPEPKCPDSESALDFTPGHTASEKVDDDEDGYKRVQSGRNGRERAMSIQSEETVQTIRDSERNLEGHERREYKIIDNTIFRVIRDAKRDAVAIENPEIQQIRGLERWKSTSEEGWRERYFRIDGKTFAVRKNEWGEVEKLGEISDEVLERTFRERKKWIKMEKRKLNEELKRLRNRNSRQKEERHARGDDEYGDEGWSEHEKLGDGDGHYERRRLRSRSYTDGDLEERRSYEVWRKLRVE